MKSINEFLIKKHLNNINCPDNKDELIEIIKDALDKGITDLNFIDTNMITDMSKLFDQVDKKGIRLTNEQLKSLDISKWDVSKVEYMGSMFNSCRSFNSDLSNWNVSNVKNMGFMFADSDSFNSNLSNWNVSNVTHMSSMFYWCKSFNSDLSNWDVSNVKHMGYMFVQCNSFNCDLSNWDVSKVKNMYRTFDGCTSLKKKPSWYK